MKSFIKVFLSLFLLTLLTGNLLVENLFPSQNADFCKFLDEDQHLTSAGKLINSEICGSSSMPQHSEDCATNPCHFGHCSAVLLFKISIQTKEPFENSYSFVTPSNYSSPDIAGIRRPPRV